MLETKKFQSFLGEKLLMINKKVMITMSIVKV